MRWQHPMHGAISPGVFIPIAEESGHMVEASRWALHEACAAIKRMVGTLGYHARLFISVNFSTSDIGDENFLEQLYTAISAVDINPKFVTVEITEALLKSEPEQAKITLGLCRKAGLNVAIDDFNTESSSLSELKSFGVNTVKIDQATDEKVRAIIDEAQTLGMITIAEGVETEADAASLKTMGCQLAQGYYFARPLDERDAVAFARKWYK